MTNTNDIEQIQSLAQDYFDALYNGDVGLFLRIFHPDARLYCANGTYVTMDVSTYMDLVRNRVAPAARGEGRKDEILSISICTPTTAHLRVRDVFLPKHFTDDLLLLKKGNAWKIISKIWDFELINA